MRSLIWKECRENIGWAFLLSAAMCGALAYVLLGGQPQQQVHTYDGFGQLKSSYLFCTIFGYAAIGLILGFVQLVAERSTDQWTTLRHRPVRPDAIFFGKAIAGLLLYFLATLPSQWVASWLVATPGNFPFPPIPSSALAGWADLLGGLGYYFAVLGLGFLYRRSWWLRLLPLALAIQGTFWILGVKTFDEAWQSALVVNLLLAATAWAALRHSETPARVPWPAVALVVVTAFYGIVCLGSIVTDWGRSLWPSPPRVSYSYRLSPEGEPLKIYHKNGVQSITTLDGKPYTEPGKTLGQIRNASRYMPSICKYVGPGLTYKRRVDVPPYRTMRKYVDITNTYQRPSPHQWFFLKEQRRLVGYASSAQGQVGFLGANGFHATAAETTPFAADDRFKRFGDYSAYWQQPEAITLVQYLSRRLQPIELPKPNTIYGAARISLREGQNSRMVLVVALEKGLAIYDDKGKQVAWVPHWAEIARWGAIRVAMTYDLDRIFVRYLPSWFIRDRKIRRQMGSFLITFNPQGEVLKKEFMPLLPVRPKWQQAWADYFRDRAQSPFFFFGSLLVEWIGASMGNEEMEKAIRRRCGWDLSKTIEIGTTISVLGLILAAFGWFLATRWQLDARQRLRWSLLIFLFNLPGFLTYLIAVRRPVLVTCPACGRPRRLDVAKCPHCSEPWPETEQQTDDILDLESDTARTS